MKKTIYILSALLLGLISCNKTEFEPNEPKKAEPTGLVAVTMKLHIPVELQAQTKAVGDFADQPSIKAIRVAVFGTSGYPQAYALAEPVDSEGNPVANYATVNGQTYYFKVLLPVYDGEAHVHVIANGDESIQFVDMTEDKIMEAMKTERPTGAYWARVIMPNGILTQLDNNGIMQTDDEGNYIPSAETAHLFEDLVLVRNFAEVVLLNESSDLKDISWVLVNVPKQGSVAPMAAGSYVDDYKDYVYDATSGTMKSADGTKTYNGFMFSGDDIIDFTVPESVPDNPTLGNSIPYPASNFMYERYHPGGDKATCILMKAHFRTDDYYTYYRLDLMDESLGGFYPVFRNNKYQVNIHKVGNRGARTITEAMNRDYGGNVSQTQEAKKLTDISDGESRLYVEYIEKNFTSGGKKTLWVQYVPDVATGTVDNTNVSIRIKTQGDALKTTAAPVLLPKSTQGGYYFYEFELNEQNDSKDLTSVLEVTATNYTGTVPDGKEKSTLYRDIMLRVMKKMEMSLNLRPKQLTNGAKNTVLEITLPEGLPESLFPLELYIEDINHTLNPTGMTGEESGSKAITVPVKTAKSLADGTTNSFYFIRTVNYNDEYKNNNVISTEFETIQNASATTLYVANEYFHTKSINLLNSGLYVNPLNSSVRFNVTSAVIEVESASTTTSWTVSGGSGVTITDLDGNSLTGGTGSGKFRMNFVTNSSTTSSVKRTATVTSGGTSQTVTVTQLALEFAITPATQDVAFNATTATVTVHAEEGKTWTATVSTGATLAGADSEGKVSGEGTQDLTVNINEKNTTTSAKTFTVTATMTDPAATTTATITQGRGPDPSSTFNVNSFTYTGSNRSGVATSTDGFINISLANVGNDNPNYWNYTDYWGDYYYGPIANGYIQMGYRNDGNNIRGTITITPTSDDVKITQIKVTYSNATYAGYEFGNNPVTVTPGEYNRDGNNSTTATWTGSSEGPVTFTNGFQNNTNSRNWPRITSIVVTYSAVD